MTELLIMPLYVMQRYEIKFENQILQCNYFSLSTVFSIKDFRIDKSHFSVFLIVKRNV